MNPPPTVSQLLRAAHKAGREAHSGVELPFEPFSERLRRTAEETPGGEPPAERIGRIPAEDFYLAVACDLGIEGAWDRFHELFAAPLRAVARRRGASPADADDIAASVPGELIQAPKSGPGATRLGTYEGNGTLLAWLARIVDRRVCDLLRRRRPEDPEGAGRSAAPAADPRDSIVHAETGERVGRAFEAAVRSLSASEFQLLRECFFDAIPQKRIAEQRGVTPARVSFLLKRTVSRVRDAVRMEIPDETCAYWIDRDGLSGILRSVIAKILGGER